LEELEVVLHLAFDELFDVDGPVDLMSCKAACSGTLVAYAANWSFLWRDRTLKDFEILQVCILSVDVKLHPGHWDIEIDTVEDLAESRTVGSIVSVCHRGVGWGGLIWGEGDLPGSTLLDLGDIQLKEVVEPCHKLLPAEVALLAFGNSPGR
jgi:hypothetical protein